jgi:hypothetical protein
MTATGIAVGLNKGHVTTKRELAPKPASRKGVRGAEDRAAGVAAATPHPAHPPHGLLGISNT